MGSAAVATLTTGGAVVMFATGASAATMSGSTAATTVSAQCQTDMVDLVGLAKNMQVDFQDNLGLTQLRLNAAASNEFNAPTDCAPFVTTTDDNSLETAQVGVASAPADLGAGDPADVQLGLHKLQQAITLTEGVQSDLGLPVGGSVPQATPPNPDIPQACVTDLDVWGGDVNNMLTADENKNVSTMQNNLTAIEGFPAQTACAPVTTSAQQSQLSTALTDFKNSVTLAKKGNFTAAATDLSNAKTIVFNTETAIGFFVGI